MAKKMTAMTGMMGGCSCGPASFVKMLIGCLIMAAGVWLFVGGFRPMWDNPMMFDYWALLYVTAGLFVWCAGKMCKMKAMCASCSMK